MEYALEIADVAKSYDHFQLRDLDMKLPQGTIMGLVGENGAGKTTTIKLLLNLIKRDKGSIRLLNLDNIQDEQQIKQHIGVVMADSSYPSYINATQLSGMMRHIYQQWDDKLFKQYLQQFRLKPDLPIKSYSKGMNMKLAIAVALSHDARLLILDEATSGLDPIVREELLDILQMFIQDEQRSVLVSSHIISDLEKVADYITFLHEGRVLFSEPKDLLLERYGVLKCTHEDFAALAKEQVVRYRKNQFGVDVLVNRSSFLRSKLEPVSIEDIMLYHIRGEAQ